MLIKVPFEVVTVANTTLLYHSLAIYEMQKAILQELPDGIVGTDEEV